MATWTTGTPFLSDTMVAWSLNTRELFMQESLQVICQGEALSPAGSISAPGFPGCLVLWAAGSGLPAATSGTASETGSSDVLQFLRS